MEKYTQILEIVLKDVAVSEILQHGVTYDDFKKDTFEVIARSSMLNYSNNEVRNLYEYYQNKREKSEFYLRGKNERGNLDLSGQSGRLNVFDIILDFAEEVLMEQGLDPVCTYKYLLRWRRTAHQIEEDIFVAAFLAKKDLGRVGKRDLRWEFVIGTNNVSLQQLLKQGLAENHFHLKGSAPSFHLSWLAMMNDLDNPQFNRLLDQYDVGRQHGKASYNPQYQAETLNIMRIQAALIRVVLFMKLSGRWVRFENYSIQSALAEKELNYDKLERCGWDKEKLRATREKYDSQYRQGEYALSAMLLEEGVLISKEHNHICETEECVYAGKVIRHLLKDMELSEEDFEKLNNVGDIVHDYLKKRKSIPLQNMKEVIEEGKYHKYMEACTIQYVEGLLQNNERLEFYTKDIHNLITVLRWEQSTECDRHDALDYAIPLEYGTRIDMEKEENPALWGRNAKNIITGERWILYQAYRKYFSKDKDFEPYLNFFYAYLAIKENIRAEIIQVNNNVGFSNFSNYEQRKDEFLEGTPFNKFYLKMAVSDIEQKGNVCSLEARITPRMSAKGNAAQLKKYIREMDLPDRERDKLFFVYHFVKESEKPEEIGSDVLCRHAGLRAKVKEQAQAIAKMRERDFELAGNVFGIDACNAEILCRPEVFAQAFRFLQNHIPPADGIPVSGNKKIPVLGSTYHVGEDFLDVADGLRAIDEVCLFLGIKCGDRIGHAIALGIEPDKWYESKMKRIYITKQAYLDNLVWMYIKIREMGISGYDDLLLNIEKDYEQYFREIYYNNISEQYILSVKEKMRYMAYGKNLSRSNMGTGFLSSFDINTYYDSWKLRGDNPECYINGYYENSGFLGCGWDRFRLNDGIIRDADIRDHFEAGFLYHSYHYNAKVKVTGNEIVEIRVSDKMIQAVTDVQKYMQKFIARLGIGIETNPTSNYLISTFKRYDKHPLLKFYNIGLSINERELADCPQILSSINTDDQGIFATCLENEYALMLLALERMEDDQGKSLYTRERIYQWLDNIRRMGLRQSFRQRDEYELGKQHYKIPEGNHYFNQDGFTG